MSKVTTHTIDLLKVQIYDVLLNKALAYGKKPIIKFRLASILPRMDAKKERIISLGQRREVFTDNESIEDSVLDLVGYSIILMMLLNDEYEKAPLMSAGESERTDIDFYEVYLVNYLTEGGKRAKRRLERTLFVPGLLDDVLSYTDSIVMGWTVNFMTEDKIDKNLMTSNAMGVITSGMLYLAHQPGFVKVKK